MDVSFYDGSDDSLIGADTGVSSGGTTSNSWYGLSEGTTYSWYVIVNDGSFSTISPTWSFTVYIDAPVWEQFPTDQILKPGDSLTYDLNATDLSGIDYYWINDTSNFNIDVNGVLTNSITLVVGTYWLEVIAYDPYGNFCGAIIKIIVQSPGGTSGGIPGYNIFSLICMISIVSLFIISFDWG